MKVLAAPCFLLLSSLALAAPSRGPSLAVLNLEHKNGVSADVAELLTANLISAVGNTNRFGRVIGTKEIESVIGFEKQKQLLSCESQSCVAELAGAMGVDYVLTGSLGRFGNAWLFNATLVSTHSAEVEGRVSRRINGTEEALLEAMDSVVAELFKQMRGPADAPAPVAARPAPSPTPPAPVAAVPLRNPPPVAAPTPRPTPVETPAATPTKTTVADPAPAPAPSAPEATATPATAAAPEADTPAPSGGMLGKALLGVGGMGLAGAALAAVLAFAAGVSAVVSLVMLFEMAPASRAEATLGNVGVYAGGGVGGVAVLGALVLAALGVGLLVAGVVMK